MCCTSGLLELRLASSYVGFVSSFLQVRNVAQFLKNIFTYILGDLLAQNKSSFCLSVRQKGLFPQRAHQLVELFCLNLQGRVWKQSKKRGIYFGKKKRRNRSTKLNCIFNVWKQKMLDKYLPDRTWKMAVNSGMSQLLWESSSNTVQPITNLHFPQQVKGTCNLPFLLLLIWHVFIARKCFLFKFQIKFNILWVF